MRKEELDQLLASLEETIKRLRQELRKSKASEFEGTFIQQITVLFEKITAALGIDSVLEEKRRIYGNIVAFLKEQGSRRGADRSYLSAAYQLCNETDSRLTSGNDYSRDIEGIVSWARQIIVAIKASYEKIPDDTVMFRTEIFSKEIGSSSVTRRKWESEGNWDDLPAKVREEFIRSGERSLEYMWYPDQQGKRI